MLKRIYMPAYELELNLGGTIVQMKRDPKDNRPYVEIDERLEHHLIGAAAKLGADAPAELPKVPEAGDLAVAGTVTAAESSNAAKPGEPGTITGKETHAMNSSDAKDFIATVADPGVLLLLLEGEKTHPQFPNGRSGVVAAIENRIKELSANH